jgi:hypothetical protein
MGRDVHRLRGFPKGVFPDEGLQLGRQRAGAEAGLKALAVFGICDQALAETSDLTIGSIGDAWWAPR